MSLLNRFWIWVKFLVIVNHTPNYFKKIYARMLEMRFEPHAPYEFDGNRFSAYGNSIYYSSKDGRAMAICEGENNELYAQELYRTGNGDELNGSYVYREGCYARSFAWAQTLLALNEKFERENFYYGRQLQLR